MANSTEIQRFYKNAHGRIEYFIKVVFHGREWAIRKRYSDFVKLNDFLLRYGISVSYQLPPKYWWRKMDSALLLRRRNELQKFITELLNDPEIAKRKMTGVVKEFLEVGEREYHFEKFLLNPQDSEQSNKNASPNIGPLLDTDSPFLRDDDRDNTRKSITVQAREGAKGSLSGGGKNGRIAIISRSSVNRWKYSEILKKKYFSDRLERAMIPLTLTPARAKASVQYIHYPPSSFGISIGSNEDQTIRSRGNKRRGAAAVTSPAGIHTSSVGNSDTGGSSWNSPGKGTRSDRRREFLCSDTFERDGEGESSSLCSQDIDPASIHCSSFSSRYSDTSSRWSVATSVVGFESYGRHIGSVGGGGGWDASGADGARSYNNIYNSSNSKDNSCSGTHEQYSSYSSSSGTQTGFTSRNYERSYSCRSELTGEGSARNNISAGGSRSDCNHENYRECVGGGGKGKGRDDGVGSGVERSSISFGDSSYCTYKSDCEDSCYEYSSRNNNWMHRSCTGIGNINGGRGRVRGRGQRRGERGGGGGEGLRECARVDMDGHEGGRRGEIAQQRSAVQHLDFEESTERSYGSPHVEILRSVLSTPPSKQQQKQKQQQQQQQQQAQVDVKESAITQENDRDSYSTFVDEIPPSSAALDLTPTAAASSTAGAVAGSDGGSSPNVQHMAYSRKATNSSSEGSTERLFEGNNKSASPPDSSPFSLRSFSPHSSSDLHPQLQIQNNQQSYPSWVSGPATPRVVIVSVPTSGIAIAGRGGMIGTAGSPSAAIAAGAAGAGAIGAEAGNGKAVKRVSFGNWSRSPLRDALLRGGKRRGEGREGERERQGVVESCSPSRFTATVAAGDFATAGQAFSSPTSPSFSSPNRSPGWPGRKGSGYEKNKNRVTGIGGYSPHRGVSLAAAVRESVLREVAAAGAAANNATICAKLSVRKSSFGSSKSMTMSFANSRSRDSAHPKEEGGSSSGLRKSFRFRSLNFSRASTQSSLAVSTAVRDAHGSRVGAITAESPTNRSNVARTGISDSALIDNSAVIRNSEWGNTMSRTSYMSSLENDFVATALCSAAASNVSGSIDNIYAITDSNRWVENSTVPAAIFGNNDGCEGPMPVSALAYHSNATTTTTCHSTLHDPGVSAFPTLSSGFATQQRVASMASISPTVSFDASATTVSAPTAGSKAGESVENREEASYAADNGSVNVLYPAVHSRAVAGLALSGQQAGSRIVQPSVSVSDSAVVAAISAANTTTSTFSITTNTIATLPFDSDKASNIGDVPGINYSERAPSVVACGGACGASTYLQMAEGIEPETTGDAARYRMHVLRLLSPPPCVPLAPAPPHFSVPSATAAVATVGSDSAVSVVVDGRADSDPSGAYPPLRVGSSLTRTPSTGRSDMLVVHAGGVVPFVDLSVTEDSGKRSGRMETQQILSTFVSGPTADDPAIAPAPEGFPSRSFSGSSIGIGSTEDGNAKIINSKRSGLPASADLLLAIFERDCLPRLSRSLPHKLYINVRTVPNAIVGGIDSSLLQSSPITLISSPGVQSSLRAPIYVREILERSDLSKSKSVQQRNKNEYGSSCRRGSYGRRAGGPNLRETPTPVSASFLVLPAHVPVSYTIRRRARVRDVVKTIVSDCGAVASPCARQPPFKFPFNYDEEDEEGVHDDGEDVVEEGVFTWQVAQEHRVGTVLGNTENVATLEQIGGFKSKSDTTSRLMQPSSIDEQLMPVLLWRREDREREKERERKEALGYQGMVGGYKEWTRHCSEEDEVGWRIITDESELSRSY